MKSLKKSDIRVGNWKQWIKALKAEVYPQYHGGLCGPNKSVCAMGVAGRLSGRNSYASINNFLFTKKGKDNGDGGWFVVRYNDGKKYTFPQIAAIVQRKLDAICAR